MEEVIFHTEMVHEVKFPFLIQCGLVFLDTEGVEAVVETPELLNGKTWKVTELAKRVKRRNPPYVYTKRNLCPFLALKHHSLTHTFQNKRLNSTEIRGVWSASWKAEGATAAAAAPWRARRYEK